MKGYAWELFRVLLETDLPGLTDLCASPPLREFPGLDGKKIRAPGPDGKPFFGGDNHFPFCLKP